MSYRKLEKFFAPDPEKGIVIYGATDALDKTGEKKLGQVITENISATYKGKIYCINTKRAEKAGDTIPTIFGKPVYGCAKKLPTVPDIAIVVTPASSIPDIIQECADVGIPAAVVFAAGFQEMGETGIALAQRVGEIARKNGVRLCGPNCFGVFGEFFNGTFSRGILAGGGYIGYISQSGGIVCGPLDTIGKLSRAASVGSMIDVTWGEMIRLFGDHAPTKAILLYLESIGKDGADFIKSAREVGRKKLIVALKAGRTEAASKAAASHTGASASNHKVFVEACRKAGIVVAEDLAEADDFLEFAKQPLPKGNRLVVLTNGGGPVVLASEQLELHGGKMTKLSQETLDVLNADMPATWSHGNPIDIIGDASSVRYRIAIEAALAEKESDGVLLTYVPLAMSNPTDIARIIIEEGAKYPDKPIIVSFTGTESVKEAKRLFREAGLAVYDNPDTAARIFAKLAKRQEELDKDAKECGESSLVCGSDKAKADADDLLHSIYEAGRTVLTEHEAKKILSAYDIPVGETLIAKTDREAALIAEDIGYPVVIKLHSTTLTHKSDVGGVELNLKSIDDVYEAFSRIEKAVAPEHFEGVNVQKMEKTKGVEVVIGSTVDPSFGNVVLFGFGGTMMEYWQDTAIAILPVNKAEAANLMKRTKVSELLEKGWRNMYKSCDLGKIEDILVAFGHFAETHPEVKEVDINPLVVSPEKVIALDARIILHKKEK
jgi:acetyltransferase